MTRDEIIERVLALIDESGGIYGGGVAANYPISTLLDEAAREVLMIAPLAAIDMIKNFKSTPPEPREDGSGTVVLPSDFIRIARFRMRGWHKSVIEAISTTSNKYSKQFHRATRGGVARPVVAIHGDKIEYFSVLMDTTHTIEEADYIGFSSVDENFPERLIPALCWLTANMTLKIMGELEAASEATKEYERTINSLYLNYGK